LVWLVAVLLAVGGARAEPSHVGSVVCGTCHAGELDAWHGSHHDLAMQEATTATVLGNFADATFAYGDVVSRFFRRDGRFLVETDGPDGRLAAFEVRYTFGVYPLQQYLIAMPGGRLQALGIAWDARPAAEGGQRWFHLYPGQGVHAGEPVHWTGRDQTWNYMCAECHSTGLVKGYDAATDRYATRWAEVDVGCEACHGPGSAHVAWAEQGRQGADDGLTVRFDERKDVAWSVDPTTGQPARSRPRSTAVEIETCGMCHGLRSQIREPWRPGRQLLDTHLTSLLEAGLFEADGKMVGEAFNYQAFRQSRMFRAGVTCSDCHEPHTLALRAEGNGVCGQCHDAGTYDTAAHHHHAPGSPAARCVACHMPERTFMMIDRRHDHGFRVPRPDLTVRFGVTNSCTDCHADRPPAWAAEAVERWHGPDRKGFQTWTEAFAAAWRDAPEAGRLLAQVADARDTPSIARATALAELGRHLTADRVPAFTQGLANPDPLVRLGALRGLAGLRAEDVWPMASPLLDDPVRGVRIEAASLLAEMPQGRLSPADRARFERAAADYVATQELTADRPEGRVNLGTFLARRGRTADAEQAFLGTIRLAPDFVPAYVNLADLRAGAGREAEAEQALREVLARVPADPALHHALGLSLARQERTEEATKELGRAAELDPANARFAYVHAIALSSTGRTDEALQRLEASHGRHPADRDTLLALVTINRDRGDRAAAVAWAEKLAAIDPEAEAFVEQLR
jgi:predicted CXXCH cytochrome family protein